MKLQDTPNIYTSYYGLPVSSNPFYIPQQKIKFVKKERKVDPISNSKGINLYV